jgi:hypothetical protein
MFDWLLGLSYLSHKTGTEFTMFAGYAVSTEDPTTHYRNGDVVHLESTRAILQVITAPKPPSHLLLGPDALNFVTEKLHALETEISEWKEVTLSTNFDQTAVKS